MIKKSALPDSARGAVKYTELPPGMKARVDEAWSRHRQAFEHPDTLGKPAWAWREPRALCIMYSTGTWYHYPSPGEWY